jgi:hypothetical protein
MSYLCVFDYRINSSNNIFTYVLSVDAIVLYLKDLKEDQNTHSLSLNIFFLKATVKSIFITIHAKLYHQHTK